LAAALLLLGPRNVPGAPQDVLEGFARSSGPGPAETGDRPPVLHRGRFSGYTNYWQTAAWSWAQHGNLFLMGRPDVESAIAQNKADIAEELIVATDLMREGFLGAWQAGAAKWAAASASGKVPAILELAEGWKEFPARGVPGVDFRPPKPSEAQVSLAFENAMKRFVSREVEPRSRRLLAEMGPGGGTGRQRNALGILYARYGLVAEAEAEFDKAAAAGYGPAVTNLANAAYLRKDYERAVKWYEEALRKSPDNKAALIGLARAKYELDAYAEADDLYARVLKADPALARRYAYLSSRIEGSASRAASSDRDGLVAWEEGE